METLTLSTQVLEPADAGFTAAGQTELLAELDLASTELAPGAALELEPLTITPAAAAPFVDLGFQISATLPLERSVITEISEP